MDKRGYLNYLCMSFIKASNYSSVKLWITGLTASNLADGAMVRSVVLFGVLIYELVGPTLTKWSLTQAGEIKPEGRASSREANQPDNKPAVTIK